MSTLYVYLKTEDKMGLQWKFGENVGDQWNGAETIYIPYYQNYENFTIIFEGNHLM